MSSSYLPSRSSVTHRRTPQTSDNPNSSGPQPPLLDQAPTPRPVFQFIAFGLIIFLGLLQFRPATHFRDPSDPFRNWVPYNSITSSSKSRASSDGNSGFISYNGHEDGMLHIVSWMECLDLRLLAVLINSTLSSSRYPHLLHFHFFVPKGNEDKVSFYKLKVLFPDSNLEFHGQEQVKEVIRTAVNGVKHSLHNFAEIVPFIIPGVNRLLSKFVYVSPNVIVKGRVEELLGIDLSNYAAAAAEDCSKNLSSHVDSDVHVLDAIRRSASKPWVSETPYAMNSCVPELSLLLIDSRKLENDFLEAFLWWSKVINWNERSTGRNPAITLALYGRYLKLSNSWLVKDSTLSVANESLVIHYDGPKIVCSELGDVATVEPGHGSLWTRHIPPMSDQILGL